MRRKRHGFKPSDVEVLESVTLMSGVAALAVGRGAPAAVVTTGTATAALRFTAAGSYTYSQANPDTGKTYTLNAFGVSGRYGPVHAIGTLTTPGFIRGGVSGTMTLVFATAGKTGGTLTLKLTSAVLNGPTGLPGTLRYTVVGGTGAFAAHHSGGGTIVVTVAPDASTSIRGGSGAVGLAFRA